MSKAGLTAFLSLIIFITSGIAHKTYAQKLLKLPDTETFASFHCESSLTQKLVVLSANCEQKTVSQEERSLKVEAQTIHEISYATEPTTFAPTPTIFETPTVTPVQTATPPTPVANQGAVDNLPADKTENLNTDLIFDLTNAHRTSIGKPLFQKDAALCQLAQIRSTELYDELFVKGGLHSGLYNRNLPYLVVENAKYGSNEAGTLRWWLNSPVHRASIENNYTYSCVACVGTQCSQLFTSYTPRYKSSAITGRLQITSSPVRKLEQTSKG